MCSCQLEFEMKICVNKNKTKIWSENYSNHLNFNIKSASFILKVHSVKKVENLTTNRNRWKIFKKSVQYIYLHLYDKFKVYMRIYRQLVHI